MKSKPQIGISRCLRRMAVAACSLAMIIPASAEMVPDDLDAMFRDARVAYERGNYDAAELGFRKILKYTPNHVPSRAYLKKVKVAREKAKEVNFKDQLEALVIKEVSLENASLNDAVAYLRKKVPELIEKSGDTDLNVNFVVFARSELADRETIPELTLNNIPVTKLIDYIGRMTGFVAIYSDGIVEFRPSAK